MLAKIRKTADAVIDMLPEDEFMCSNRAQNIVDALNDLVREAQEETEFFPVIRLHRGDIEARGGPEDLSDEVMKRAAMRLNDMLHEMGYDSALSELAYQLNQAVLVETW